MRKPVTIEEFLELEEGARKTARLRAPAREVRRFHAAVRRFATAWGATPVRRVTAGTAKDGVSLYHELKDQDTWVPMFTLRAAHPEGEFYLEGPNPKRKRLKLSEPLVTALDDLNKEWRKLPGADGVGTSSVIVHLPRLADSGFDRFLEVALKSLGGL